MEGSSFDAPKQFSSPEEEVAFLRSQLAERERQVLERQPEMDVAEREALGRQTVKEYHQFTPKRVLDPAYELEGQAMAEAVATAETAHDPAGEIVDLALREGIKNALSVLDRVDNPHTVDEVHRRLVEHIARGSAVADLTEGVPPWHVLHMTLFEITLPAQSNV